MWEMEGRGSSGHFRRSEVDGVLLDELEAGMIRSNGPRFLGPRCSGSPGYNISSMFCSCIGSYAYIYSMFGGGLHSIISLFYYLGLRVL